MTCDKGIIFNIQRFSIHDGPGIRTVVFLKGCPLHCPWCSNPESQNGNIQITWDEKKCTLCKKCISWCPTQALSTTFKDGSEIISVDNEGCVGCLKCTHKCPESALSYEGKFKGVDEIIKEVMKDDVFYEESGGGITLSGGEILAQANFAIKLLEKAHENRLHTACETTCYTDFETFTRFIKNVDLLLCDIKHFDSAKHEEIVGVPLEEIQRNIKYAVDSDIEVIGRIPIIPGFNFSIKDANGLSDTLIRLGIHKVNLLPFHQFGENKYKLLNKTYRMGNVTALQKDDPQFLEFAYIFKSKGLEVSF
jgi:pyruvate formate lyase activating enzyme